MGHVHEFELKAKTYSPPCPPEAAIRAPEPVLLALRCGVTQYAYMCRCGERSAA